MAFLRTFAPIATAHFFAHVTHTSCIADHEGKHDAKGANISTRMERESVWHHGIAVDPPIFFAFLAKVDHYHSAWQVLKKSVCGNILGHERP